MADDPKLHARAHLKDWKHAYLADASSDAFLDLDEAIDALAADDPRAMLEAMAEFLAEGQDQTLVAYMAAGPLEDLLGAHGAALIEDVERLSRENAAFQHALGGVWQNDMSDEIWERVLKAGPDQRW